MVWRQRCRRGAARRTRNPPAVRRDGAGHHAGLGARRQQPCGGRQPERQHRQRAAAVRSGPRSAADAAKPPTRSPSRSTTRRSWRARGQVPLPTFRTSGSRRRRRSSSHRRRSGLRLVHLRPIVNAEGARLGAVATEHVLSPAPAATTLTPTDYTLETDLAPAYLRTRSEGAGDLSRPGRGGASRALGRAARRGVGGSGRARGGACTLAPHLFRHGHRRGRRHGAALHRAAARPAHRRDRTPLPDFHGGRVRARLRRRIALVDGVRRCRRVARQRRR